MWFGIDSEFFVFVCVVVDKIEKFLCEKIEEEFREFGVSDEAVEGILAATSMRMVEEFEVFIGLDVEVVKDLKKFFEYVDVYGY